VDLDGGADRAEHRHAVAQVFDPDPTLQHGGVVAFLHGLRVVILGDLFGVAAHPCGGGGLGVGEDVAFVGGACVGFGEVESVVDDDGDVCARYPPVVPCLPGGGEVVHGAVCIEQVGLHRAVADAFGDGELRRHRPQRHFAFAGAGVTQSRGLLLGEVERFGVEPSPFGLDASFGGIELGDRCDQLTRARRVCLSLLVVLHRRPRDL